MSHLLLWRNHENVCALSEVMIERPLAAQLRPLNELTRGSETARSCPEHTPEINAENLGSRWKATINKACLDLWHSRLERKLKPPLLFVKK